MYYLVLPECVCTPWDERPDFVPACKIGCCQAGFVWNTMCWKPLDRPSEVISWSQEPNYGCQSQSYQPHMLQSYSCSISRGISLVMYHKLYIIQRTISNYWSVSIRKDEKGLISSHLAREEWMLLGRICLYVTQRVEMTSTKPLDWSSEDISWESSNVKGGSIRSVCSKRRGPYSVPACKIWVDAARQDLTLKQCVEITSIKSLCWTSDVIRETNPWKKLRFPK